MDEQELSWIYMTAGSLEEARQIGRVLVEKKLAACVNLIEGMCSLYQWNGEIQEDRETVMIAKTRHELVGELTRTVKSVHSYDCPCILELPVHGGNPEFLDWIRTKTDSSSSR